MDRNFTFVGDVSYGKLMRIPQGEDVKRNLLRVLIAEFRRTARCLALISLVASFSAIAADKEVNESCFLALPFGDGNFASLQFSNFADKQREATVERYSASGRLLDAITKPIAAVGKTEIRIDLTSPNPELGWIRVLTKGKGLTFSMTSEWIQGGKFESLQQHAVYRHPEPMKRLPAGLHKWTLDLVSNLGSLAYFVNLSEYPVQVAMCQDDVPGCTSPTLPHTVAPRASISFPLDHSRRYATIESTPGYSVATSLALTEGKKRVFDTSSCIKFDGSTSCAPAGSSTPKSPATKYVSPLTQSVVENSEAAKHSPAALARKVGDPSSQEEIAEWIKNGKAAKCVIVSEPPGAEIFIDGAKWGIAPNVVVLLKRDAPRVIEIRMAGYRTIEKHIVPDGQPIILGVNLERQ